MLRSFWILLYDVSFFDARISSEVCSLYLAKNMPQNKYWSFDKINRFKQAYIMFLETDKNKVFEGRYNIYLKNALL